MPIRRGSLQEGSIRGSQARSRFTERFVVDVFCLGVKNALFRVLSEFDYDTLKTSLMASHEDQAFESIHPACARKLVEGAVAYAEELSFSCHFEFRLFELL
jgi:hypothetical protein